jgi:hypothetical protein
MLKPPINNARATIKMAQKDFLAAAPEWRAIFPDLEIRLLSITFLQRTFDKLIGCS